MHSPSDHPSLNIVGTAGSGGSGGGCAERAGVQKRARGPKTTAGKVSEGNGKIKRTPKRKHWTAAVSPGARRRLATRRSAANPSRFVIVAAVFALRRRSVLYRETQKNTHAHAHARTHAQRPGTTCEPDRDGAFRRTGGTREPVVLAISLRQSLARLIISLSLSRAAVVTARRRGYPSYDIQSAPRTRQPNRTDAHART